MLYRKIDLCINLSANLRQLRLYSKYRLIRTQGSTTFQSHKKSVWRNFLDYIMERGSVPESLKPPSVVRGMMTLDRKLFERHVSVPTLLVPLSSIKRLGKSLRGLQLSLPTIKPIADLDAKHAHVKTHKMVLLDPTRFQSCTGLTDADRKLLLLHDIDLLTFDLCDITLTYKNWNFSDILRSVLPENHEGVGGFTSIGHILHLNLDGDLEAYKSVIGEVLLDKVPSARTVVNKINIIDNTYRNFQMEVIAGEDDLVTTVKEHGMRFQMDFSKVYWNSRLSTEHTRIVQLLHAGDVVYDMFAGIGPFALPAAKKKNCVVLANDLNPESYKWLNENVKLNKISHGVAGDNVRTFNMDARRFVTEVVKPDLLTRWHQECQQQASQQTPQGFHMIMNLPALAVDFLDVFSGLFHGHDLDKEVRQFVPPTVHCYCFSKEQDAEADVRQRVEERLGCRVQDCEVRVVRNVAPNKEMLCVRFTLTKEILCGGELGVTGDAEHGVTRGDCEVGDLKITEAHCDSTETGDSCGGGDRAEEPASKKMKSVNE